MQLKDNIKQIQLIRTSETSTRAVRAYSNQLQIKPKGKESSSERSAAITRNNIRPQKHFQLSANCGFALFRSSLPSDPERASAFNARWSDRTRASETTEYQPRAAKRGTFCVLLRRGEKKKKKPTSFQWMRELSKKPHSFTKYHPLHLHDAATPHYICTLFMPRCNKTIWWGRAGRHTAT